MELFIRHGVEQFFHRVPAQMSGVALDIEEKQRHIVATHTQNTRITKELYFIRRYTLCHE